MSEDKKSMVERWNNVFHVLMRAVVNDIQRRLQPTLDEHGLSKVHVAYLLALDSGRTTLRGLSDHLSLDKANTTRAVNGLRETGLAGDDRETESSRKYNVFLTEKGKELVKILKTELNGAYDQYMDGISKEEIQKTLDVLDHIRENVESPK